MGNIQKHTILPRTADEKRHMVFGRPRGLQILHGHSRMHRGTLIRHDEPRSCHIGNIQIVVHRIKIYMRRLVQNRQRPHKIARLQHTARLLERINGNTGHLVQYRMHRVPVRHGQFFSMRTFHILHHIRQKLDAEFRITAKPQLLAEPYNGRRTGKRLLSQLAGRHPRQHAEIGQQKIGNRTLRF